MSSQNLKSIPLAGHLCFIQNQRIRFKKFRKYEPIGKKPGFLNSQSHSTYAIETTLTKGWLILRHLKPLVI